jgi:putative SOS response-associated peptidase YedK
MCGRYTLGRSTQDILKRYAIEQNLIESEARFNIAPSQLVAVVMDAQGNRTLDALKWGLVPFWVKDLKKHKPLINARAESLAEKPSFKQALLKRRCIIPADGFYEWKGEAKSRTPVYFKLKDGSPFGFAGIWEQWTSPDGEVLRTCAIITVEPNHLTSQIHNRMPAILKPEDEAIWLNAAEKDPVRLLALLKPYPHEAMEAFEVSAKVNSPSVESAECVVPVAALSI